MRLLASSHRRFVREEGAAWVCVGDVRLQLLVQAKAAAEAAAAEEAEVTAGGTDLRHLQSVNRVWAHVAGGGEAEVAAAVETVTADNITAP